MISNDFQQWKKSTSLHFYRNYVIEYLIKMERVIVPLEGND